MMARFAEHDFLYRMMLDELLDRLGDVQRELKEALVIGCPDGSARTALEAMGKSVVCVDPGFAAARAQGGVQADEDALPFADDSFDLVIACGPRSEERRAGKEWASPCSTRWSPYH